jgi:hypothetical protein
LPQVGFKRTVRILGGRAVGPGFSPEQRATSWVIAEIIRKISLNRRAVTGPASGGQASPPQQPGQIELVNLRSLLLVS